jgi:hypothetical protein
MCITRSVNTLVERSIELYFSCTRFFTSDGGVARIFFRSTLLRRCIGTRNDNIEVGITGGFNAKAKCDQTLFLIASFLFKLFHLRCRDQLRRKNRRSDTVFRVQRQRQRTSCTEQKCLHIAQ